MDAFDILFGLIARGPRFFSRGWGDRSLCDATDPAELARRPPARLAIDLGPPRPALGGLLQEGSFESPEPLLPPCARRARFRLLLPRRPASGVAVHLAASGDQGFAIRLRFAAPLLAEGIGALVLEHPFYGARRPHDQPRHAVRSVSDLHLMGRAAFLETRGLLRWLGEALRIPRLGVTGYSMGGQLAAMAGASWPEPLAVVPVAPECSPDSVLREGALRHVAHWRALAGARGDERAARDELLEHLGRFSVTALPPPRYPAAAIVVGTRADGVVPPRDMEAIARHWGAELRWLPAGHVTAVVLHRAAMRRAIADAFGRLHAAMERNRTPAAGRATNPSRAAAEPDRPHHGSISAGSISAHDPHTGPHARSVGSNGGDMGRNARRRSEKRAASERPAGPQPDGLEVEAVKTTQGRAATTIQVDVEAGRVPGGEPPEELEVVAHVPKAGESEGEVRWEEQPLARQGESGSGSTRKLRYVGTRYEGTDAPQYGVKVRVKTKAGAVEKEGIPVRDAGCHGGSGPDGTSGR